MNAPAHLFAYGLLQPGLVVGRMRQVVALLEEAGPATVAGTLYDVGPYPAFIPTGPGPVHGLLLRLPPDRGEELLAVLDAYEGPDYQRQVLPATPAGAVGASASGDLPAWVYVWRRPTDTLTEVTTGRWSPPK